MPKKTKNPETKNMNTSVDEPPKVIQKSYVIPGNPVTKKNSQIPVMIPIKGTNKRRPVILPSKQFQAFEKSALKSLKPETPEEVIDVPVNVCCKYFMKTRRKVDLNNLLEATCDILVKAKFLKDDNNTIVSGHDNSRVYYDKDNPRTEIYITNITE